MQTQSFVLQVMVGWAGELVSTWMRVNMENLGGAKLGDVVGWVVRRQDTPFCVELVCLCGSLPAWQQQVCPLPQLSFYVFNDIVSFFILYDSLSFAIYN